MSIKQLPELIPYGLLKQLAEDGVIDSNVLENDSNTDDLQLLRWRKIFIQHVVAKAWRDPNFRIRLFSTDPDIVKQAIKDASSEAGGGEGYEFRADVDIRCVPDPDASWNGQKWETTRKITVEIPVPMLPGADHSDSAPNQEQIDAQENLEAVLCRSLGILGAGNC